MNSGSSSSDPRQLASAMRKMNEDPLFQIRKEEARYHKNLLENPLVRERMKQLLIEEKQRGTQTKEEANHQTAVPDESRRRFMREKDRIHDRRRDHGRSRSRSPVVYRDRHARQERHRRSRSPSTERRRRSRSPDRYRRRPEDYRYDKRR
jgi:hypothetical protein